MVPEIGLFLIRPAEQAVASVVSRPAAANASAAALDEFDGGTSLLFAWSLPLDDWALLVDVVVVAAVVAWAAVVELPVVATLRRVDRFDDDDGEVGGLDVDVDDDVVPVFVDDEDVPPLPPFPVAVDVRFVDDMTQTPMITTRKSKLTYII